MPHISSIDAIPERLPTAGWTVVPAPADLATITRQCRRMVNKRALLASGVALIPIPGLDWLTDVGVLLKLLPDINKAFGLTPEQVEQLAPDRRVVVYKALSAGGSLLVGKVVTRNVVMAMLKAVGVRLTAQQAAKFVPIAGQAVSAALTFSALKLVCELHIKQCVAICEELSRSLPAAQPLPDAAVAVSAGPRLEHR